MFATQWFNDTMNLEMYLRYYNPYKIFEGFINEMVYMVPRGRILLTLLDNVKVIFFT